MKYVKRTAAMLLALGMLAFNAVMAQESADSRWTNDTTDIYSDYGLDEIVVTGTRTEKTLANTPVLTRVVSGVQIRQNDFENIVDALEFTVPGLSFRADGRGNNISVQGLENKYILILVDGERLSYTPGGNIDFDRLNLSNIKQIEVVKGASSVLYGSNAIGMIINIITQTPTRPLEGWAKVRYGRFNDLITNGFLQADWQALPKLNITGGARYTHHSAFGNAFTPKLNIMYSPVQWRFRSGYSKGFKAPSATELYSDFMMGSVPHNIGNPDLKAEKSDYLPASEKTIINSIS